MKDIPSILQNLENNPLIFRELMEAIPVPLQNERRVGKEWTIHEWAAHLSSSQEMLNARYGKIREEEDAYITAHLPDFSKPNFVLLQMDMAQCLEDYSQKRQELLMVLRKYSSSDWQKKARHEEYAPFNPYLLLRHTLLVDNVHFFNIERLWLTKQEYI